jgi:hypothetical protein
MSKRMPDMHAFLILFPDDVCLAENPAVLVAMGSCRTAVPDSVLDEEDDGTRLLGAGSRRRLHCTLHALVAFLRALAAFRAVRRSA